MSGLTRAAVRRPLAALASWLLLIVVLALLGTGVESRLTQSIFILPGTETARSFDLAADAFGENVIIPILLEGPEKDVDRQGRRLTAVLAAREDTRVLSPWDRAAGIEQLRPGPRAALIVTTFDVPYEEAFDTLAPEVRELVDSEVSAPVEARITGMPIIGNDLKQATYDSANRAELIAIPILLVVLLLVFRAPLAALIPALTGLTTLFASAGLIWILAGPLAIDPIAVLLASMMGLALGVDYSLLIVSRFREELQAGRDARGAAVHSLATAGRTVLFAGSALAAAMVVAMVVVPGALLLSAAVGVLTATALSVISAFVAMPAALTLLGERIDVLRVGGAGGAAGRLALVAGVMKRPGFAAIVILLPLLVFTVPAMALDTGPPDVAQLPEGSRARADFERVRDVMGPGWAAPFQVLVVGDTGTITEPSRLRAIRRFQRQASSENDVLLVVGPGRLLKQSQQARSSERELARGQRGLERLRGGLRAAHGGLARIDVGLDQAAAAAGQLAAGGEQAGGGAGELSDRLGLAAAGSTALGDALGRAEGGTEQLVDGLVKLRGGLVRLGPVLGFIKDKLSLEAANAALAIARSLHTSVDSLESLTGRAEVIGDDLTEALAQADAMTIGKGDPAYPALRQALVDAYSQVIGTDPDTGEPIDPGYRGLVGELDLLAISVNTERRNARRMVKATRRLSKAIGEIKRGTGELRGGARTLKGGASKLADGIGRTQRVTGRLGEGLEALAGGAGTLQQALGQLAGGGGELASGLSGAGTRVRPLISGLGQADRGIGRLQRRSEETIGRTLERSPGLFESGYFVLAAIDGADQQRRERAELAVNASRGGEAAQIVIVPRSAPNSEQTGELRKRLSAQGKALGEEIGGEVAVGGTAAALAEYDDATSSRLPLLILALAVASYFVLIPIFRSIVLPAIAVLLNLLSVAVAFGALALLFQGDNPALGGPGYVDAATISAIYTVVFGLSLDYQVFLISRMREGWVAHGDAEEAIRYGLERTAAVVTGAAAIMTAVFLAFALSEITNTRQFGVGLAIAVLVDATIVRLLLLPAVMRLFGDECWALPRWMDRKLPRVDA
jgi:RND superfamily putative drug exporter